MIDVDGKLLDSWQELLDGNLSVPAHKAGSVDDSEAGNYVEYYVETGFGDDTKHSFRNEVVVITNIVTRFEYSIDHSVAHGIDSEIKILLKSSPGVHNLIPQSGMQIVDVRFSSGNTLEEYESGIKYYRKIVRYTHRIVQT